MYIQFKKGILELCILALLKDSDRYGYDVANELSGSIGFADGSVYPVLRRLRQDEAVTVYLAEASGGPPRKYYAITQKGREMLTTLEEEWSTFCKQVNSITNKNGAYSTDDNSEVDA
ncbi:MAG: PadR family transcriptional regulator [Oscillospiraceae bacterium]|jgi:PadR family transcriptional regulator PadR|nr:PadR family transcriptional regulator [Oscillospiraceae bacterium]